MSISDWTNPTNSIAYFAPPSEIRLPAASHLEIGLIAPTQTRLNLSKELSEYIGGYLRVVGFAFWIEFGIEIIWDTGEGIVAYLINEISELSEIVRSEAAGVGGNDRDKGGGLLCKEVIEGVQMLVHLWDGKDHFSLN